MTKETIPGELLELVQRPAFKDGKPATETKKRRERGETIEVVVPVMRAIEEEEVFDWAASDTAVTVVTKDGHKYRAARPAPSEAKS